MGLGVWQKAHNHVTAALVRVRRDWGILEAEHMAMLRPKPYGVQPPE